MGVFLDREERFESVETCATGLGCANYDAPPMVEGASDMEIGGRRQESL